MRPEEDIRVALIPAAGLGTRLLPVTKVVPKELLPVLDKPAIQFAVEEAVASGIQAVVLVINSRKDMLLRYFQPNRELHDWLARRGKTREARTIRKLENLCSIQVVRQEQPRGLGDAILSARSAIGDRPFVVILPDVVILARTPCTLQLIDCYRRCRGSVVAMRKVRRSQMAHFGVLSLGARVRLHPEVVRVHGVVEKPQPRRAPSTYGIFGRYLLEPGIFDYISRTQPPHEVQISDAISRFAQDYPVYGFKFEGEHYDLGDKFGYFCATVALALRDSQLRGRARQYLNHLKGKRT